MVVVDNDLDMERIYEGWLTKSPPDKQFHSKLFKSKWRRRYFVLYSKPLAVTLPGTTPAALDYYKSKENIGASKPTGTIDLTHCGELTSHVVSPSYQYMFKVKTLHRNEERTYYLAADNERSMNGWIECLCTILGLKENEDDSMPRSYTDDSHLAPSPLSTSQPTLSSTPPKNRGQMATAASSSPKSSSPHQRLSQTASGRPVSRTESNRLAVTARVQQPSPTPHGTDYVELRNCTSGSPLLNSPNGKSGGGLVRKDSSPVGRRHERARRSSVPDEPVPLPPGFPGHEFAPPVTASTGAAYVNMEDTYDTPPLRQRPSALLPPPQNEDSDEQVYKTPAHFQVPTRSPNSHKTVDAGAPTFLVKNAATAPGLVKDVKYEVPPPPITCAPTFGQVYDTLPNSFKSRSKENLLRAVQQQGLNTLHSQTPSSAAEVYDVLPPSKAFFSTSSSLVKSQSFQMPSSSFPSSQPSSHFDQNLRTRINAPRLPTKRGEKGGNGDVFVPPPSDGETDGSGVFSQARGYVNVPPDADTGGSIGRHSGYRAPKIGGHRLTALRSQTQYINLPSSSAEGSLSNLGIVSSRSAESLDDVYDLPKMPTAVNHRVGGTTPTGVHGYVNVPGLQIGQENEGTKAGANGHMAPIKHSNTVNCQRSNMPKTTSSVNSNEKPVFSLRRNSRNYVREVIASPCDVPLPMRVGNPADQDSSDEDDAEGEVDPVIRSSENLSSRVEQKISIPRKELPTKGSTYPPARSAITIPISSTAQDPSSLGVQYLDLDLDPPTSAEPRSSSSDADLTTSSARSSDRKSSLGNGPPSRKNSPSASSTALTVVGTASAPTVPLVGSASLSKTDYKEIDFVKTRALSHIREDIEKRRKSSEKALPCD